MNRKDFIKVGGLAALTGVAYKLNSLQALANEKDQDLKMPVLFLGHGSPMNAIEENEFVAGFRKAGESIQPPRAILCVSAHWETKGTFVTAMEKPKTIHDFGGFPKALFDVQYPAPGSPAIASEIKTTVKSTEVGLDQQWGLDHGCWSVVKHLYPQADIPVLQLSIYYTQPPAYHFALAQELAVLRKKGILILGSGNMVHNLGMIAWDKMDTPNYAFPWAEEASSLMKKFILEGNVQGLIDFKKQGKSFDLAIPTPEHYLPLLYCMALKDKQDGVDLFNDKAVAGSLTMTSAKLA